MAEDTDRIRTQIRLPADLYESVKAVAGAKGLSLNEAMVRLMRVGLSVDDDEEQPDRLAELEARVRRLEHKIEGK